LRDVLLSQTLTNASACANGKGSSITAFTTLKMVVVAPIPSAKISTTSAAKPGFVRRARVPYL
jgi:hypothetical protein